MLIYDRSLNIIAGNRAAERIVGLPLAQLIGKPGFTSLLPCVRADGTPLPEAERPTRATVRSGKPQTDLRIGIQRADGAVTWLSVNTAFLRRVDDTDYYGLVSTITDVTEQTNAEARLKESEARFRRTFELAGSGMAHIGMDRRFIRVNRRLCEILGYREDELLKLTGRQISHPDDLDIINEQRPALHAGEIRRRAPGEALPAQGRRGGLGEVQHDGGARRRRQAAVRDRGLRRHHRAARRRGAPEGERGALPPDLRARRLRHLPRGRRPLRARQPQPVRDPRLLGRRSCSAGT